MAYEIGAVRASASLDASAFDAGVRTARSSLKVLQGGFQETSREALRSVETMSRAWDNGLSKTAAAARNQIEALTGLDRANKNTSASAKSWVAQLNRQAKSFDGLRSSLDPVFASTKQYEAAVERAEKAVRSGIVSQTEANRVLEQAAQKYLGLVPAAEQARQAEERAAKETRNLRSAYETTRASLDPLYASSQKYAAIQTQMNAATAAGVISQREAAAVMDQAAGRYLGTATAAGKYGAAMKSGSHHTANLAYQVNDIGVMMAAGQNPFILAIQQGTQVSQVFGQMSQSGQSLSSGMRAALMSVVSPMALLTIGAIAGTAALVQWGVSAFGASSDAETLADAVKNLDQSSADYLQTADVTKTKLADLRKEYGKNAGAVREVYDELVRVSEQMALNDLDAAVDEAAGSLSALVGLVGDLSEARMELGVAVASGFEGAPLPKAELDALEAQVSDVLGTIQDEFSLTSAEAYRVKDAIDAMNQATSSEEAAQAARRLSLAISSSYEGARRIPKEMGEIATIAAKVFATFSRIDHTSETVSRSVRHTGDDTYTALGATVSWLMRMSDVRFEVEGIVSAFNAINGGLISGAAKQVELQALQAGESLQDARQAAEQFQTSIKLDQTIATLEGNWGAVGTAIGGVLTLGNRAAQNLDANLATQRDATREAERSSKGAGAAARAASSDLSAEIAQRQTLLGLTDDQRTKYQAILTVQQKLGKDAGKYSKAQIEAYANQIVSLDATEAAMQRVNDQQIQWSENITRTAFEGGSLSDTIEGMLRDIAYQFAHSKIVLPVIASVTRILGLDQLAGGSVPQTLAGGGSGGGGGTGIGGNLLSTAIGGSTFMAGVSGGASAALGIGTYAGAGTFAVSANAAMASAVTGASTLATTIGAALPVLAAVVAVAALLKKGLSREYAGTAIRGNLGADGFDGDQFDFHKGGFLRSNRAYHKPLADELEVMLDQTMQGVTSGLTDMAGALGLSADAIEDFNGAEFTLWTNGKDAAQIQQELQGHIEAASDEMAGLVLGTDKFTRAGEAASATLTRLSSSLTAVNDMADLLGHKAFNVSLRKADAASHLVDVFGGLEAMTGAVNTYWLGFYSEAERTETTLRRLEASFADLGVSMPQSREGFRALVESIDLTSETSRELYADLVNMAGAMDQVLPQVSAFTLSMSGMVDQISGEIGAQLDLSRLRASEYEKSANLWYRTAATLRDLVSDMLNTDLSAASRSQTMAVNRNRFDTAFDMARGGDVDAARDIPGLTKAYLNSARDNATTSLEYRRIAAQVQGQISFLAGVSELEGANDDILVTLYNQQIETLTGLANFLSLESLTADQVGDLTQGVQDLHADWDGTVASFKGSLSALEEAILNAEAFSYDDLVGRLDVAVSLSDSSPAWLQRLVDRADTGMRTTLDFVIRQNDLTPDMRWLAVNSVSEHVKSLDFILRNDVSKRTRQLALAAGSELRRNIHFIVGTELSEDLRRIALAGNSELSRVVTASLPLAQSDDRALQLALANVGDYAVTVSGAFEANKPGRLLRRLLHNSGGYSAMVEAAIDHTDEDTRRVLLRRQGRYVANIRAAMSDSNLTARARRLLLNDKTEAIRRITLRTTGLTSENQSLIDAINGSDSQITLAGNFKFSPEEAFSTYFSSFTTGSTNLQTSMNTLGDYLDDLRTTVDADRNMRQAANLEAQGAVAATTLIADRTAARDTLADLKALFSANNITSVGGGFHMQDGQLASGANHWATSGSWDGIMNALATNFDVKGGTLRERVNAVLAQVNDPLSDSRSDLRDLRQAYRTLTGEDPSFDGGGYTGNGARTGGVDGKGGFRAILHPRETVFDHTKAYAPPPVYRQTQSSGSPDVVRAIETLKQEVAGLRDESAAYRRRSLHHQKTTADIAEKTDAIGPAPPRVTA